MPRIRWTDENEATGDLAEVYREYMQMRQRDYVPDILRCFSARPDVLRKVIDFSDTLHFSDGHLDRRVKEMIATYVSALNRCPY